VAERKSISLAYRLRGIDFWSGTGSDVCHAWIPTNGLNPLLHMGQDKNIPITASGDNSKWRSQQVNTGYQLGI
jgi:hypothetical protein